MSAANPTLPILGGALVSGTALVLASLVHRRIRKSGSKPPSWLTASMCVLGFVFVGLTLQFIKEYNNRRLTRTENTTYMLVKAVLVACVGLAGIFIRDYRNRRREAGFPPFPMWLSRILQGLMWIVLGFVLSFLPGLMRQQLTPKLRAFWLPFEIGAPIVSRLCEIYGLILLFRFRIPPLRDHPRQRASMLKEVVFCIERKLPLDRLFEAFAKDRKSAGAYAASVANQLRAGVPLSKAFSDVTFVPPHAVAAIRAGENNGGRALPEILKRVADDAQHEEKMQNILTAALYYPMALAVFILPIMIFLGTFLAPKFRDIFRALRPAENNGVLRGLAATSLMENAVFILLPAALLLAAALHILFDPQYGDYLTRYTKFMRRLRSAIADRLPLLRPRLRNRCLGRSAGVLSAMAAARVPFPDACRWAAEPELAGPFSENFKQIAVDAENGRPPAQSVAAAGLPESFVALLRSGFAGGNFDRAMAIAAEWHETAARRYDRILSVLIPCTLLLSIGLLVGSVYIGVFRAIYEIESVFLPY